MDQVYNDIFETLFSEFPVNNDYNDSVFRRTSFFQSSTIRENLREVRNYISTVSSNSEYKKIRPDAKLFLVSNYYSMVLLPVLLSRYKNEAKFPLDDDFKNQIRKDIDLIFSEADKIGSKEISSHTVIQAINNIWEELFTTVRLSWADSNKY